MGLSIFSCTCQYKTSLKLKSQHSFICAGKDEVRNSVLMIGTVASKSWLGLKHWSRFIQRTSLLSVVDPMLDNDACYQDQRLREVEITWKWEFLGIVSKIGYKLVIECPPDECPQVGQKFDKWLDTNLTQSNIEQTPNGYQSDSVWVTLELKR